MSVRPRLSVATCKRRAQRADALRRDNRDEARCPREGETPPRAFIAAGVVLPPPCKVRDPLAYEAQVAAPDRAAGRPSGNALQHCRVGSPLQQHAHARAHAGFQSRRGSSEGEHLPFRGAPRNRGSGVGSPRLEHAPRTRCAVGIRRALHCRVVIEARRKTNHAFGDSTTRSRCALGLLPGRTGTEESAPRLGSWWRRFRPPAPCGFYPITGRGVDAKTPRARWVGTVPRCTRGLRNHAPRARGTRMQAVLFRPSGIGSTPGRFGERRLEPG